jgi:hypothetical protein
MMLLKPQIFPMGLRKTTQITELDSSNAVFIRNKRMYVFQPMHRLAIAEDSHIDLSHLHIIKRHLN